MPGAGTIFGVLGFITGCIGAVTGVLAYRRTGQLKTLDLRLLLRANADAFAAMIASLSPLMRDARQSRTRVLAADGLGRSGNEKFFIESWEKDSGDLRVIEQQFGDLNLNYSTLKAEDMERSLGDLNRLSIEASRLLKKYQDVLQADDVRRAQIRSEKVTMIAAQLAKPAPHLKSTLGGN